MLLHVQLQRIRLLRDQERDGRKVKQLWEGASDAIIDRTELFFAAKIFHAWVPIEIHFFLHHGLDISVHQTQPEPVELSTRGHFCEA